MSDILTLNRCQFFLRGIFGGLVLAFLIVCLGSEGVQTPFHGRVGGDFPAFYGAAKIINSGKFEQLYDLQAQQEAQADLFPPDETIGHLIYAYPPYVALILAPLGKMNFKVAYFIYTSLMFASLIVDCWYLKKLLPNLPISYWELSMLACLSYPLFRAIPGGQNTSLSLLCLVGAVYYLRQGFPIQSGLFLGIWLFKLQYALPAMILCLVTGKTKILLGILPIATAYYLLGVIVGGWAWPSWWIQTGALPFLELDQVANTLNFISLRAFWERIIGNSAIANIISISCSLLILLALSFYWKKYFQSQAVFCLALASCGLILISPHAMFYDAGLAFVAGVYLCQGRSILFALAVLAATWLNLLSPYLPIQPTFILLLILSLLVLQKFYLSKQMPFPHKL